MIAADRCFSVRTAGFAVDFQIFLALDQQRRLYAEAFRAAALAAFDEHGARNGERVLVDEAQALGDETDAAERLENTNAALPPVCRTKDAATATSSTVQQMSCRAVRFSAEGAAAPVFRPK